MSVHSEDQAGLLESKSSINYQSVPPEAVPPRVRTLWRSVIGTVFIVAIIALVVVIVVTRQKDSDGGGDQGDWEHQLLKVPSTDSAQTHLRTLSSHTTLAGTPGDYQSALYVKAEFEKYGLQNVRLEQYEVLLSYPISSNISIVSPASYRYTASRKEDAIPQDPTSGDPDVVAPYIGYSPSADITAMLVYVNYGTIEDFQLLDSLGVPLEGKIALVRFGKNFRGLKVMIAQRYKMAGVLIYSDPADDGFTRGAMFPNGPWRPPSSVQRGGGGYISYYSGDPLTPGVAAKPGVARKYNVSDAPILPKIPVQVLSWRDAQNFLTALGGQNVSSRAEFKGWQGGFEFEYHIGPGPAQVNLVTNMSFVLKTIWDVVGEIPAAPTNNVSRGIIMGAHRDAWVFGAVDPHSGSSVVLETARALGTLYTRGWRPRRSITICSWDAEEPGLIGSVEFVEDNQKKFSQEIVAYMNLDAAVVGRVFTADASPSLADLIRNVSRFIVDPDSQKTLYESWVAQQKVAPSSDPFFAAPVGSIGSGSDYSGFFQYLGISVLDIRFDENIYGVYHSVYDSITWMEKFGDPGYKGHVMLAQTFSLIAYHLADDALLHFNMTEYAVRLTQFTKDVENYIHQRGFNVSTAMLWKSVNAFSNAASSIMNEVQQARTKPDAWSPSALQSLNDRLAFVERQFLSDQALPGRPEVWYKHVVYAPGFYAGYDATTFPGVRDALFAGDVAAAQDQMNILVRLINNAALFLITK